MLLRVLTRSSNSTLLLQRTALRSFSSNAGGSGPNTPDFTDTLRKFSSTSPPASTDEATTSEGVGGVFDKIAVLGTGMMAQAMMDPMIASHLQPPEKFTIYDVNDTTMLKLQEKYGVNTANSIPECLQDADLVITAVKPQNLTPHFYAELQKGVNPDAILLSVIAGVAMTNYEQGGFTKIVRSMPNTPATIGQGMTVWSCTPNLSVEERKKIRQVLSSCGKSLYVDDEHFIDMATSISGSGPAYVFLLMESMIDAGVHMGFPRDKATTLVYHTMLGSVLYAMESKEHPAILRNRVTSPSGTTASALYELENGRFRTVVKDAMWACYRRSLEMGKIDSNVGPGRSQVPEPVIRLATDSDDEEEGAPRYTVNVTKES